MKDMLIFAGEHPVLSFFLAIVIGSTLVSVMQVLWFYPLNRWMRSRNIAAKGWPPPHLDADGDFRKEIESEDEQ